MNQTLTQQTPLSVKVDESILVVKRELLFANGVWQGMRSENVSYYQTIIATSGEFHWRSAMETNPTYKQIIPYMIFEYEDSYFLMERKATASEQRLKSKLSLGIGGHVRQDDIAGATIFDWAKREFHEEVSYHGVLDIEPLGILNDDGDAVGQVHLGLILLLHGNNPNIAIRSEHKQGSLVSKSCMDGYFDRMESWSKISWHHMQHLL